MLGENFRPLGSANSGGMRAGITDEIGNGMNLVNSKIEWHGYSEARIESDLKMNFPYCLSVKLAVPQLEGFSHALGDGEVVGDDDEGDAVVAVEGEEEVGDGVGGSGVE